MSPTIVEQLRSGEIRCLWGAPFYKVAVVGWYVMKWASFVFVIG